ncbi:MAG: hypothetical protein QM674_18520, partial [Burkholderiaceae bacterium]
MLAVVAAVIAICAAGAAAIWYIHATTPVWPPQATDARPTMRLSDGTRIPLTVRQASRGEGLADPDAAAPQGAASPSASRIASPPAAAGSSSAAERTTATAVDTV